MSEEETQLEPSFKGREEMPGCFAMVLSLFLRPSLAMAVSQLHGLWGASALFILSCLLIGAVAEGAYGYSKYSSIAVPIVREVAANIAPVSITGGKISWQASQNGNYTLNKNGWNVRFSQQEPVVDYVPGEPDKGVWVTQSSVFFWNVMHENGNRIAQHKMMGEPQLLSMEKSLTSHGEKELGEKDLVNACLVACAMAFPCLVFWFFCSHCWCILFCLLIFCMVSMLYRRDVRGSFWELFRTGVNLCAVPTLATLIWYAVTPASWTFDNIFYACFILYIIFVYRDTRLFLKGHYDARRQQRR